MLPHQHTIQLDYSVRFYYIIWAHNYKQLLCDNDKCKYVTHVSQYTRPTLVQIMALCWTINKPLSEPLLAYCYFSPWKSSEINIQGYSWKKVNWKGCLQHAIHFVSASICKDYASAYSATEKTTAVRQIVFTSHLLAFIKTPSFFFGKNHLMTKTLGE